MATPTSDSIKNIMKSGQSPYDIQNLQSLSRKVYTSQMRLRVRRQQLARQQSKDNSINYKQIPCKSQKFIFVRPYTQYSVFKKKYSIFNQPSPRNKNRTSQESGSIINNSSAETRHRILLEKRNSANKVRREHCKYARETALALRLSKVKFERRMQQLAMTINKNYLQQRKNQLQEELKQSGSRLQKRVFKRKI